MRLEKATPVPVEKKNLVGVFFTCVFCGMVEEIPVPREERLPPKVYWECLTCQMRDVREVRKRPA